MKRQLILLALIFLGQLGWSQQAGLDFNWAAKVSNRSTLNTVRIRDNAGNVVGGGGLSVFDPQIGAMRRSGAGNFWEFTLDNIAVNLSPKDNSATPAFKPSVLALGAKVGYFYTFLKHKDHKFYPMLGLELQSGVFRSQFRQNYLYPITGSSQYRTRSTGFFCSVFLTPRVMWLPAKRWFLDASMNINLFNVSAAHVNDSDPLVGTSNGSDVYGPAEYGRLVFTVGIGFKL